MALAVVSGDKWLGRETRTGNVLYVAAEGALGMKLRLQAHRDRFGINDDAVRFIGVPFDVRSAEQVKAIITTLEAADIVPNLIVIDALARVAVGADENSAKDMGQVVEGFQTLNRETGATVLAFPSALPTTNLNLLQSKLTKARVIIRAAALGPAKLAVFFGDGYIINTRMAHRHVTFFIELPVFVTVRAEPITVIIVPLIGKTHGNAVACVRPQFLD